MAFTFDPSQKPADVATLWQRLVDLVRSMNASVFLTKDPLGNPIALVTGAAGTLVPHGQITPPKFYSVQPVGSGASSAVVTKGPIGSKFLTIYTTANTDVEIELKL